MRLSKRQLDTLSTFLGLIAGITGVLTANKIIAENIGGTISGISLVILGYLTNQPASARPTTEDLERKNI